LLVLMVVFTGCKREPFRTVYSATELCEEAEHWCEPDTVVVEKIKTYPVISPPIEQCVPLGEFPMLYFDENRSDLRDEHNHILDFLSRTMNQCPELNFLIVGHCDERRSDAYNYELGLERAENVANALIERGTDSWRLETISKGKNNPFADGHIEDIWKLNRRVEIEVVK